MTFAVVAWIERRRTADREWQRGKGVRSGRCAGGVGEIFRRESDVGGNSRETYFCSVLLRRGRSGRSDVGGAQTFALVLSRLSVGRFLSMNREELRERVQAAANRFTDELVEYFGQMLQSVVKDVTLGVTEVKPLRKAAPPAPKKPAPKKPAPKKVSEPAPKKAAPKAAPKPAPKPAPKAAKAAKAAKAPKAAPKKAKVAPAKPAPKAAKPAPKDSKNIRRSNRELDQAADMVVKLLKDEGRALRIEEINKRLGTSTRELMRPIKKLLSGKKIQRRGERRSTTYFV